MPNKERHIPYMKRCLELAQLGIGNVAPNPMVGAVLVYQDRIIGEGFHEKCGEAHAEVNAINCVADFDQHLISSSTLYVSLEPCSHHGKTPPCSDLIVESKIPHVVIGCVDSYSEVAGKGIEKLKNSGISVEVGILENEARNLNKRFFTYHEKKRPYIILKWAKTQDGFIDVIRESSVPNITWITSPETQQLTHQWRAEEAAILVGYQTVINDNPSLTVRASSGSNPTRIILSSKEDLPQNAAVLDQSAPTHFISRNATIKEILENLHKLSIQSVIIEGGKKTLEKFIAADVWDEARILTGEHFFKNGIKAPKISGKLNNQYTFGNDLIEVYLND